MREIDDAACSRFRRLSFAWRQCDTWCIGRVQHPGPQQPKRLESQSRAIEYIDPLQHRSLSNTQHKRTPSRPKRHPTSQLTAATAATPAQPQLNHVSSLTPKHSLPLHHPQPTHLRVLGPAHPPAPLLHPRQPRILRLATARFPPQRRHLGRRGPVDERAPAVGPGLLHVARLARRGQGGGRGRVEEGREAGLEERDLGEEAGAVGGEGLCGRGEGRECWGGAVGC